MVKQSMKRALLGCFTLKMKPHSSFKTSTEAINMVLHTRTLEHSLLNYVSITIHIVMLFC